MPTPSTSTIHHTIKARLLALPPRAFELFTGDLLEFMGLRNVSVTRYTSDGGIDATCSLEMSDALISIPTGVQVKRHRNNVQRADIDRFIGALSGKFSQGIFITTSNYAKQAALKAVASVPRIATVNGDQIAKLMLQHRFGVTERAGEANSIDEAYFAQFEALTKNRMIKDSPEQYLVGGKAVNGEAAGREARPEDDLVSLRALSHALRVDPSVLRRWLEKGQLQPDQAPQGSFFFRRDRIETIRAALLTKARPASAEEWRQEFLDFARSRNLSKSYKPVMLKALLKVVDRNGEARIDELVQEFRAFYVARQRAGLTVEFGPPNPSDAHVSDAQLRQLIVKNPLERFLIKGFLEYVPDEGVVRFAPQLWQDLRYWELLDIEQRANEQLSYYYSRPSPASNSQ